MNSRHQALHFDDYHGTIVADPFRWLEDPASPETISWVEAQNAETSTYFASSPLGGKIKAYLTRIWNYPKYTVPQNYGSRYFFFKNTGLQSQAVLFMQESIHDEPVAIIDPNALSRWNCSFEDDFLQQGWSLARIWHHPPWKRLAGDPHSSHRSRE